MRNLALILLVLLSLVAQAQTAPAIGVYADPGGQHFSLNPRSDGRLTLIELASGRRELLSAQGAVFANERAALQPGNAPLLSRWPGQPEARALQRLPVQEQDFRVSADDGTPLQARLLLPPGPGPHPVVLHVHGSGKLPALGFWADPYVLAAGGVGAVVFDKRGSGRSGGSYTADFRRLAADVVAVAQAARAQPGVDAERLGLAGFSQGGWVAPLAASLLQPRPVAVLVAYGTPLSPLDEDHFQCRLDAREAGATGVDLPALDALVDAGHQLLTSRFEQGWDALAAARRTLRGQPWFQGLDENRCIAVGLSAYPAFLVKRMAPGRMPPQIDWAYHSEAVLAELALPMRWLFAGADREAPVQESIAALERWRAAGKPIELRVFEGVDHGMLQFEPRGRERVVTGVHPGYANDMLAFWRRQFERPQPGK